MNLYIMLPDGSVQLEPDILKWADWMEAAEVSGAYKIKSSRFGDGIWVSTVFLGVDVSGRCFETVVFGSNVPVMCYKHATKADAVVAHDTIVTILKLQQERRL